jgi:hypothetical protein
MSQQVLDMAIPQANAMVAGGMAEFVDEEKPEEIKKPEEKSEPVKVETAALTPKTERAMAAKPSNRAGSR